MATFLGDIVVKSQGEIKAATPQPAARGTTPPATRGTVPPAARGASQPTALPDRTGPTLVLDYIHAKGAVDAVSSQWIDAAQPITGMNLKTDELFYSETLKQFRIPGPGRIAFIDNRAEEKPASHPANMPLGTQLGQLKAADILEVKLRSAPQVSVPTVAPAPAPVTRGATPANTRPANTQPFNASTRGISVFVWQKELLFDGAKNEITLSGDVLFAFQPNKPLPISGGIAQLPGASATKPAGTQPAGTQPAGTPQTVRLNTQNIVVKLIEDTNKDAKRDGGILKMDAMTVKEVFATGGATISLDDYTIAGNDLLFDVLNNKAIISGKGEDPAMVTRAGQARVPADRFELDLTANKLFLHAVRPRGNLSLFGGQ